MNGNVALGGIFFNNQPIRKCGGKTQEALLFAKKISDPQNIVEDQTLLLPRVLNVYTVFEYFLTKQRLFEDDNFQGCNEDDHCFIRSVCVCVCVCVCVR